VDGGATGGPGKVGAISPVTDSATQPSEQPTHLVQTEGGVQAATRHVAGLPVVALDTEFHAERRYFPEIMLLQVGCPSGEVWIADPRQCDLGPLIRAISGRRVIVHAGQEDLAILHREADTAPVELLDVQIAAGLVGLGYPARLGDVCEAVLDRRIDKGATLSNWAQRPLSALQVAYAAQDVRVLIEIERALENRLTAHGRSRWAEEASAEMGRSSTRPHSTRHKWTDWEIAPSFDSDTRRTLQAVFEWRDARGRDKDQPPHFMLGDGIALDLARRRPRDIDDLQSNRRIPAGLIRRYGDELIRVVNETTLLDDELVAVPTARERGLADALRVWAEIQAPVTGLAAKLVMPRALALSIARKGHEALVGWRVDAIGQALASFLDGRVGIRVGRKGLVVE
jgi:ribonuclease D